MGGRSVVTLRKRPDPHNDPQEDNSSPVFEFHRVFCKPSQPVPSLISDPREQDGHGNGRPPSCCPGQIAPARDKVFGRPDSARERQEEVARLRILVLGGDGYLGWPT